MEINKKEIKYETKVSGDKVQFITIAEDLHRIETVPKHKAIELYRNLKNNKQQIVSNMEAINKRLTQLNIERDEELEKFLEMANKAQKYNEYKKLIEQRDALISDMATIDKNIKDIENALPEVKRSKKK